VRADRCAGLSMELGIVFQGPILQNYEIRAPIQEFQFGGQILCSIRELALHIDYYKTTWQHIISESICSIYYLWIP